MYYDKRNRDNIAKLAPNTKKATEELYNFALANDINILIYDTLRTVEQQKINVANGASQTMQSYHIVGQAFDFVPTLGATTDWGAYNRPDIKKFIDKAKTLGFEWGGDWKGFVDKCHMQYNFKGYGTDKEITTAPTAPTNNNTNNSIVDFLNGIGQDSSFNNRKNLATKYGINNYTGTADQNTKLLNILKNSYTTQVKPSGYTGTSIVDYLKSVGQPSTFAHRKNLATQNGIGGYAGTESQNLQLLKKLRGF